MRAAGGLSTYRMNGFPLRRRLLRHAVIIRIGPGLRVMGWVTVRIERAGWRKLNVQDRMQLDAVSGDSGLAMEEIEHTDASHFNGRSAIHQQEFRPGRVLRKGSRKLVPGRLNAILDGGVADALARRAGNFDNHRVGRVEILQNDMKVV